MRDTELVCEPRALTTDEISQLEAQGCRAENWSLVRLRAGATVLPGRLREVRFSGAVTLGSFTDFVTFEGDVRKPSGIYNAMLHNTTVGDDAYIENVGRHIAHYDIAAGAVIENIGCLVMDGESAFGNGTRAKVLVETGGREVLIFDRLSCQVAYILALYRDRAALVHALEAMIEAYADGVRSARGTVGKGARIADTDTLVNVKIGAAANITGALKLENGSVNSTAADPAHIGYGVIAKNFIAASGSNIYSGADITNCFVGQGARLGRQFAAEHSLFFANFAGDYGEACSLFAGPFTASHHKSTLLLAALCSFFNAGSGTNFSNHAYKLGPLHQGILERGCKTGSSSHVYWPARIGAFTTVIGRSHQRFDSSAFPFSYLVEEAGESVLIPAVNLFTVGTVRDTEKWLARDRRRDPDVLDLIHYGVFTPYSVGRILQARTHLLTLAAEISDADTHATISGVHIPRDRLMRAHTEYGVAVDAYLGAILARRIEREMVAGSIGNDAAFVRRVVTVDAAGTGAWVDVCGLYAPQTAVDQVLDMVEAGEIDSVEKLQEAFRDLFDQMSAWEENWAIAVWLSAIHKDAAAIRAADLRQAILEWREASRTRFEKTLTDAEKEYDLSAQISYGIDMREATNQADAAACSQHRAADFVAVRGAFADNSTVRDIRNRAEKVNARAAAILDTLPEKNV